MNLSDKLEEKCERLEKENDSIRYRFEALRMQHHNLLGKYHKLEEAEQERDRYKDALESIKKHIELSAGKMKNLSTVYKISQQALDER